MRSCNLSKDQSWLRCYNWSPWHLNQFSVSCVLLLQSFYKKHFEKEEDRVNELFMKAESKGVLVKKWWGFSTFVTFFSFFFLFCGACCHFVLDIQDYHCHGKPRNIRNFFFTQKIVEINEIVKKKNNINLYYFYFVKLCSALKSLIHLYNTNIKQCLCCNQTWLENSLQIIGQKIAMHNISVIGPYRRLFLIYISVILCLIMHLIMNSSSYFY